jgi:hypothetical protein
MFTQRDIRTLKRHYPTYSINEIEAALILCMLSGQKNLY